MPCASAASGVRARCTARFKSQSESPTPLLPVPRSRCCSPRSNAHTPSDANPLTQPERHALLLTDGGIYDNLGLSVLEPGRSSAHTPHTYDVDYIVACDAGAAGSRWPTGHFATSRMKRSFDVTYRRAQDASRGRLHQAAAAGLIQGFVHSYLGMPDARLPMPVADLSQPRTSGTTQQTSELCPESS